jgi:hypothetical protein
MMEFAGEFTVDGTPEELWKYFTDPDILQDAAPGCESMTLKSPSQLTATLAVGVGSVKPSFDVDGVVTEADRPNRLEIEASGEASRNSFEVSAWQELRDNGDGTTTVVWEANADVSGIIASMGERALGSVADNLVNDFFRKLEDHVNAGTPAESRLRSVDEDEAVADAEEAVSEPEPADAGAVGGAVGMAAGALGGEDGPPAAVSLVAGVALGVTGTALWNRLRGRTATPAEETPERVGAGRSGGGQSLLTVGLALALGAVSALLWTQSRDGGVTTSAGGTDTAPAGATTTEPPTETAEAPAENGTESGAGDERGDPFEANPIDWLESR